MKKTALYSLILDLAEPWSVEAVELNTVEVRVDIRVGYGSGVRCTCLVCGWDYAWPLVKRHLDTCQFKTFLRARIPRVYCPEHDVLQVNIPWAKA